MHQSRHSKLEALFSYFDEANEKRLQESLEFDHGAIFCEEQRNPYKERHEAFLKKLENHEFGVSTESGENLEAIKLHDLSAEEASIIYMYTNHSIHGPVNSNLRNSPKNLDKDIEEYIRLFNSALLKLPALNNDRVYRDVNNPDGGVKKALEYYFKNIGSTITCHDYMSSHKDKSRWSDYKTGFQFLISTSSNSRSRDLKNITFSKSEKEVVFISGTKFIVKDVNLTTNVVVLEEINNRF